MDHLRGHKIEKQGNEWIYSDTKEPTASTYKNRNCGHCGMSNTEDGHDGCLRELPGLMNACCGHGQENEAYVQFTDGKTKHGIEAIEIIKLLKL